VSRDKRIGRLEAELSAELLDSRGDGAVCFLVLALAEVVASLLLETFDALINVFVYASA